MNEKIEDKKPTFSEARQFYRAKDYKNAFEIFSKLANMKNSEAQLYLGIMYENGFGVPKNLEKAKEWWRKASRLKNVDAQFRLETLEGTTFCRC
jgi:TPR repeat protein